MKVCDRKNNPYQALNNLMSGITIDLQVLKVEVFPIITLYSQSLQVLTADFFIKTEMYAFLLSNS